jgi:Pup amidohydrolase
MPKSSTRRLRGGRRRCIVPKILGGDVELGNFVLGAERPEGTAHLASAAILQEVDGCTAKPTAGAATSGGYAVAQQALHSSGAGYWAGYGGGFNPWNGYSYWPADDPQDRARRWLRENGGCIYIDLDHTEFAIPEVRSAYDFVAVDKAMVRIVRKCLHAANARRPAERKIVVLANNSDGRGNSYGSHLNLLVTRQAWDDLFALRLYPTLFNFIAYQVSSIIFTGQGKVGAENGRSWIDYQISQRADFFETLVGEQTTVRRPLANSRDEPLCGSASNGAAVPLARLHCIFYDNTLCHTSTLLKAGVMQIIGAQIEADDLDPNLILEDPLAAILAWSRDPDLKTRARLISGRQVTAAELQLMFLERAAAFVRRGRCRGVVPHAASILALWEDTLRKLEARDFDALTGLDWVLKRSLIERARGRRTGMSWSSPDIRFLDFAYSNLDENEGLYWACERSGLAKPLVTDAEIDRFVSQPPDDTRAWTRAMILRSVEAGSIADIDWHRIELRVPEGGFETREARHTVRLDTPLGWRKRDTEDAFRRSDSVAELLRSLASVPPGSAEGRATNDQHPERNR